MKHAKLLVNLINPINALSGMTVNKMIPQRGYRRVLAAAIKEAAEIVRRSPVKGGNSLPVLALGFTLPIFLSLPDYLFTPKKLGQNYTSSMLQDMERRRRRTEIDYLCGEIVRLAKLENKQVPVNAALAWLMQKVEASGEGLPCISPNDLVIQLGLKC